ncbi:MAG: hypothetical protein JW958_02070 [Candidatus Eisenbacteria bacterium]|nr:hypothetical protein [Candidatus Eisenbacteria bacterium]
MADRHALTRTLRLLAPAAAFIALLAAAPAARTETALRVSPDRAVLLAGDGARFRAELPADWEGANPLFTWEVIPRRLGVVGPDGSFVAGGEPGRGILRVEVRSGARRAVGHALIRIVEGGMRSLTVRVEPSEAATTPGGEIAFRARAFDPSTGTEATGTTEWRIVPSGAGDIDGEGVFRAGGKAGHARIAAIVVAGEMRGVGYARVRIGGMEAPEPAVIRVAPAEAETAPGGEILFRAEINPPGAAGAVQWMAVPERIGAIADGLFRAGPFPGEGRIIASLLTDDGFARDEARVRVSGAGLPTVAVRPENATVRIGGEVRFRLVSIGAPGSAVPEPVDWTVDPPEAGRITPDGLFLAADREDHSVLEARVTGRFMDLGTGAAAEASARVRILGDPSGEALRVRPAVVTVDAGEQVRFTVENGPSDELLRWDLDPPNLGTITPDGLFTANRVFADLAGRESNRREGSVLVRTEGAGRARMGRARVLVGGEESTARLFIDPPSWTGAVTIEAALSGKGIPFRARIATSAAEAPAVVQWRLEPSGRVRAEPPVGDRTSVVWAGNDASANAALLYQGNLVAELVQPNGRRIGAVAPIRIAWENLRLNVKATPANLDLPVGSEARIVVEASTSGGEPVDLGRLEVTGKVHPSHLGEYQAGTGVFLAEREGVGTIVIRAGVPGWPITGSVVVPVRVRGDEPGGPGPGSGG